MRYFDRTTDDTAFKQFELIISNGSKLDVTALLLQAEQEQKRDQQNKEGDQLQQSEDQTESTNVTKPPSITELSQREVEKLLGRLPPITTKDSDETNFALRDKTIAPPSGDVVVQHDFPPELTRGDFAERAAVDAIHTDDQGNQQQGEPRELGISCSPQGNVLVAAQLQLTFTEPMVEISSVSEVEKSIPAKLEPASILEKGKWKWDGAMVLTFEPEGGRFPMSTEFKVTIPAGTKSVHGAVLKKDTTFSFTTPTLEFKRYAPTGTPRGLRPHFWMEFNQRIDPEELFKHIRVTSELDKTRASHRIRLLNSDEEPAKEFNYYRRTALPGTFLEFVAGDDLPKHTTFTVEVMPGAPSAEGPLKTPKALSYRFETYGPLKMTGQGYNKVSPGKSYMWMHFSNELEPRYNNKKKRTRANAEADSNNNNDNEAEAEKYSLEKVVEVTPAIDKMKLSVSGGTLGVSGMLKPSTKYVITINTNLEDIYGQHLVSKSTATFTTTKEPEIKSLYAVNSNGVIVMDPYVTSRRASSDANNNNADVKPVYSVMTQGYQMLRVLIFQVKPEDFQHSPWGNQYSYVNSDDPFKYLGVLAKNKVKDYTVEVQDHKIMEQKVDIDIQSALQNADECLGQVIIWVEPHSSLIEKLGSTLSHHRKSFCCSWIQVTRMAIDVFITYDKMHCWANSLQDGAPLDNVVFHRLSDSKTSNPTQADGTTTIESPLENYNDVIIAKRGKDIAFMYGLSKVYGPTDTYIVHSLSDRNIYKPKEKVFVKGWVRLLRKEGAFQTLQMPTEGGKMTYTLRDSRGNAITEGECQVDLTKGSFDFSVQLTDTMNLGHAVITMNVFSQTFAHTFQVQEYRIPEFKVDCKVATQGPFYIGGKAREEKPKSADENNTLGAAPLAYAIITAQASYYSGGALTDVECKWKVKGTESTWVPPNWQEFSFGKSNRKRGWLYGVPSTRLKETKFLEFNASTDTSGTHYLKVSFPKSEDPPCPVTVSAEATVMDLNRQSINANTTLLLHPSSYYVGIRSTLDSYYTPLNIGDEVPLEFIVVDVDGKLVKNVPIKLQAQRKLREGETKEDGDSVSFDLTSTKGPLASNALKFPKGGSWTVKATVEDPNGRTNYAELSFMVRNKSSDEDEHEDDVGIANRYYSQNNIQLETPTLKCDKETYQPGETAKITVESPFPITGVKTEGLLTVMCNSVAAKHRFEIAPDKNSCVLEVPIIEQYVPNCLVRVDLRGSSFRVNDKGQQLRPAGTRAEDNSALRPAYATNSVNINVPPLSRKLKLNVAPQSQKCIPGQEVKITVDIRDFITSSPAPDTEVALIVVDDAVLSLTGFSLRDPIDTFYPHHTAALQASHSRSLVSLLDWRSVFAEGDHETLEPEKKMGDDKSREECGKIEMEDHEKSVATSYAGATFGALANERPMMMKCMARSLDTRGGGIAKFSARNAKASFSIPEAAPMEAQRAPAMNTNTSMFTLRVNFDALAAFVPSTVTDSDGRVVIPIKLPDSLTRYRIIAVAASNDKFGVGESFLQTQLPLAVRPSLPRFLNFGDSHVELPVVLVNQTEEAITVNVAARTTNCDLVAGAPCGFKVSLPQRGRTEVRFVVDAKLAGTARFQVGAEVCGDIDFTDSAEVNLPVCTPATTEAFATYGEIDDEKRPVVQPVRAPPEVFAQFGHLSVTMSSTALHSLTDAFLYVYSYQYECSEQLASKVLGISALGDVLLAFDIADVPTKEEQAKCVNQAISKLCRRQKFDGGFGMWTLLGSTFPFLSVHVAHAFMRAIEKGYDVPATNMSRSLEFLSNIESHMTSKYWDATSRNSLKAFALFIISKMKGNKNANTQYYGSFRYNGTNIAQQVVKLYNKAHPPADNNDGGQQPKREISTEGLGWLLAAGALSRDQVNNAYDKKQLEGVIAELLKHITNNSTQTAETAHFVNSSYPSDEMGSMVFLSSNTRTDAIMLEALIEADRKHPLIPKLAKGLFAHRKNGRWSNTSENTFVLLALDRYFREYESQDPDFVARVWLDRTYAGQQEFKGRSTEKHSIDIPMKYLLLDTEGAASDATVPSAEAANPRRRLVIQKQGHKGRLYYRIGLTYAPKNLRLDPSSYGFTVVRTYEAITINDEQDPKSMVRYDQESRTWLVKAGARLRVRLTMTNKSVRYHVALVDKLPAGFEPINPELSGAASIADSKGSAAPGGLRSDNDDFFYFHSYFYRNPAHWFEHQNIRDERVEAFTSYLYPGHHDYSYVAVATTPGTFVAPPAHAEEMYSPEVFGRSATDIVRVVTDM